MSLLRVMTLNAWSGLTYKGLFRMGSFEPEEARLNRFEGLVAEIKRLKPDIIVINEANPLPSYCDQLSKQTGYGCIWHMGVSGLRLGRFGIPVNLREGDAILAKKELGLEFMGRIKLAGPGIVKQGFSAHRDDLTQAILGKITIEGKEVYVCATHWHATLGGPDAIERAVVLKKTYGYSNKEYDRVIKTINHDIIWKMREARNTIKWLKHTVPDNAPIILMGDLNAEPDRPDIECLRLNGFHKAIQDDPGFTWDPEKNTNLIKYYPDDLDNKFSSLYDHLRAVYEKSFRRTIDYIMMNDYAELLDSRLCANEPFKGSHISDHFGVIADIKIP
jgi:endonuclease/exonuclease/phosphatase family metal-dependent hydrolase